jgi:formiminotetrahydrofolate cyclodeaminase
METSNTTENLLNILIAMKKISNEEQSENFKKYFNEVLEMLEDNYRVIEFIKQQNNLK